MSLSACFGILLVHDDMECAFKNHRVSTPHVVTNTKNYRTAVVFYDIQTGIFFLVQNGIFFDKSLQITFYDLFCDMLASAG